MSDSIHQTDSTSAKPLAEVVEEATRGDRAARETLVRRYLRPAYCVALSIVRRPADAEDVAQDSLIKALTKIETCRSPERFEAWLMQIVRNHSRNWLDRRRLRDVPRFEVHEMERAPGEKTSAKTDRLTRQRQLSEALAGLNETQRAVVLLHDLEGYTHPEIADALELSVVNSRQYLFVARRRLREHLGEGGKR